MAKRSLFLGRAYNTDQNFVALLDGSVARCRAMARVVEDIRWDHARVQRVTGTPLDLTMTQTEPIEDYADPHRGPAGHRHDGPDSDEPQSPFRRLPILLRDLHTYGFHNDPQNPCQKCLHYQR